MVTIFANGDVMMNNAIKYDGYCTITSEFYPFDSHACYVFFNLFSRDSNLTVLNGAVDFDRINAYHPTWWIRYDIISSTSRMLENRDNSSSL